MQINIDFYELPDGSEPAKEFLETLDTKTRAKMYKEIDLLLHNGPELREPHSKPVRDGIFELRAKCRSDIARVLFFFYTGGKAILTNGFIKKTARTPEKEIQLAMKYRKDYLKKMRSEEE